MAFRAGMPRAALWFTARAGGKENRPLAAGSADLLLALRSVPASSYTGRCALSAGVCSMFLFWSELWRPGRISVPRNHVFWYKASYQEFPKMNKMRTRGKSTRFLSCRAIDAGQGRNEGGEEFMHTFLPRRVESMATMLVLFNTSRA